MSLHDVWEGAAGNPFHPSVAKERQFLVGFSLLLLGILEESFFAHENHANFEKHSFSLVSSA